MTVPTSTHPWQFFRVGGFDQVSLDSWDDLSHLTELDQKLWVALSVPSQGLSIDAQTLAQIDSDGDGHIRPPELLAAIAWAGERITDRDLLTRGQDPMPLSLIDAATHPKLRSALEHILIGLDKAGATEISVDDTREAAARFAARPLNGDGIISPASTADEPLAALISDLASAYGGPLDRNGSAGIDQPLVDRFKADLEALLAWLQRPLAQPACQPLGNQTAAAGAALAAVQEKTDDYFTRCRLAAFDPRAEALMNGSEEQFKTLSSLNLANASIEMRALPMALVGPGRPLPLEIGVNPAWTEAVSALQDHLILPLLGARSALDETEWLAIQHAFSAYTAWQASRPENPVSGWDQDKLLSIADSVQIISLEQLIAADLALAPEAEAMAAADRITRYVRDLPRLIHNFVAFRDFYSPERPAAFQTGTLYIDGRSCELCLEVLDPAKHATLAGLAGIHLAYCECSRLGSKRTIAAAITAGDADQLTIGRNGVFYDRQGQDWDATVVRIVDHPISLRQAFWSPYKKVAKLVAEQVQKLAAAKSKNTDELLSTTAAKPLAPEPSKPSPFDAARFAGIFAAIGLALGALGTALAALVTGFLGLKAWQIPLALVGILLLISGPAMAMAWFKLRNRSLAALLDANGWAVNARTRINIPFGTSLTRLAQLPEGANRSRQDPYADKPQPWSLYFVLGAILTLAFIYLGGGFGK